mmetsp:Transcript_21503/g.49641  ORF Transcript_21503/g.49641 Transcript_21503/m.49641 type:complete len:133 (+) Transcript_21503:864-1262(+)
MNFVEYTSIVRDGLARRSLQVYGIPDPAQSRNDEAAREMKQQDRVPVLVPVGALVAGAPADAQTTRRGKGYHDHGHGRGDTRLHSHLPEELVGAAVEAAREGSRVSMVQAGRLRCQRHLLFSATITQGPRGS